MYVLCMLNTVLKRLAYTGIMTYHCVLCVQRALIIVDIARTMVPAAVTRAVMASVVRQQISAKVRPRDVA